MTRLGIPPFFISAVGSDQNGKLIASHLKESGMVGQTAIEFLNVAASDLTHIYTIQIFFLVTVWVS